MILVSDYFKLNNEKLITYLKDYTTTNPCCDIFPNCLHPEYQSCRNLFNLENEDIKIIKKNYFDFLKNSLKKESLNIINSQCWVYLNYKGQKPNGAWHVHAEQENKINLSGMLYLTDTYFGTEFKTKFLKIETIPYINRWYLWESCIQHRPIDAISDRDRLVIATTTIIEK